jgi:hypothetical protein
MEFLLFFSSEKEPLNLDVTLAIAIKIDKNVMVSYQV